MYYQNDSIKFELAPLWLEQGNHLSTTAAVQGVVRPSSCWAHSGTGGATGAEEQRWKSKDRERGVRTEAESPSTGSSLGTYTVASSATSSTQAYGVYEKCCFKNRQTQASSLLLQSTRHNPPHSLGRRHCLYQQCSLPIASFMPLLKHYFSQGLFKITNFPPVTLPTPSTGCITIALYPFLIYYIISLFSLSRLP